MAVIDKVAAHQGWPLRGVPLYSDYYTLALLIIAMKIGTKLT